MAELGDVTKKNLEESKGQTAAIEEVVTTTKSVQFESENQTTSLNSLVPTTEVVQENTTKTS